MRRTTKATAIAFTLVATVSCGVPSKSTPDASGQALSATEASASRGVAGAVPLALTPEPVEGPEASGWASVSSLAFSATAFAPADGDGAVLYEFRIGDKRAAPAFEQPEEGAVQVGFFIEGNMGLVPSEVALDPAAHACFDRVDSGTLTSASIDPECLRVFTDAGYDLAAGRFPAIGRQSS
jgi:hypothetical protein